MASNAIVYIIFATSELDKIDFSQVYETSASTLRLSVNGLKTFVKYAFIPPPCIELLTTKEGPYTHEEMQIILNTSEWKKSLPFYTPTE
jgi:hypothetical protein